MRRQAVGYFNSRPSARGDEQRNRGRYNAQQFQFTPLREGRLALTLASCQGLHFNSRPSARGDASDVALLSGRNNISIHAPPRGATGFLTPVLTTLHISIHAPPRGATLQGKRCRKATKISIHAPPRGATGSRQLDSPAIIFQFTPLREGRRARLCQSPASYQFQFTPLREGRHVPGCAPG